MDTGGPTRAGLKCSAPPPPFPRVVEVVGAVAPAQALVKRAAHLAGVSMSLKSSAVRHWSSPGCRDMLMSMVNKPHLAEPLGFCQIRAVEPEK